MEQEDKPTAASFAPALAVGSAGRSRPSEGAPTVPLGSPRTSSAHDAAPSEAAPPEASSDALAGSEPPRNRKRPKKGPGTHPNNVRRIRIERMMSKAELARRANVSVLTIDRVEKGFGCRMDTKRKILEALGLTLADRVRVFGDEE